MQTITFSDPGTGFTANVTVTDNGDGTLSFVVEVDEGTGTIGDMRAIYFNNTGDTFYSGLAVTVDESDGDATTTSDTTDVFLDQEINKIRWVGSKDTNVNGEVINENGGAFDTGIEFGSQGMATDDVQRMEFTLSADTALTLDSFDWSSVGLRATSVGDVDGSRDGSLKLTGEAVENPDPNSVVAVDDAATVPGELLETIDALQTGLTVGNAISNDYDPDFATFGDTFDITSISSGGVTDETVDMDGWFGWLDADQGGQIRVHQDGTIQFRDLNGEDFGMGFEIFAPLTTSVEYEILDSRGAIDTAVISITILPNEIDPGD